MPEFVERVRCWQVTKPQKEGDLYRVELESTSSARLDRAIAGQAKFGQHGPVITIESNQPLDFEVGKDYEVHIRPAK